MACNTLINSTISHRVGIRNISDYSPFGVLLKERSVENEFYRRSFNGMETDPEVKGKGNDYTTEFRNYDSRIARWISLDPMMSKYPDESPYAAFHNNPIYWTDPKGNDPPQKAFQDISNAMNDVFQAAWGNSFVQNDKGKIKAIENGGVVLKRTIDGEVQYQIHNEGTGLSAQFVTDYSNVPEGWEIAGDFHTHPYTEKDAADLSEKSGWDGLGMAFSDNDFKSVASSNHVKDGHVAIVESGDMRFGMVITDKKSFTNFVSNGGLEGVFEDIANACFEAIDNGNGANIDQVYWDTLQSSVKAFEAETGKSPGFELFSAEVAQDKQDIEGDNK